MTVTLTLWQLALIITGSTLFGGLVAFVSLTLAISARIPEEQ